MEATRLNWYRTLALIPLTLVWTLGCSMSGCFTRGMSSRDANAPRANANGAPDVRAVDVPAVDKPAVDSGRWRDGNAPTDPSGWTVITASADTRIIHVSHSEGNDANNGLSPAAAVKTIARGADLVRDGFPDQLLLRKGDVWNEAFPSWKKSGRSPAAPLVIGSYGSGPRPLLRTPRHAEAIRAEDNVALHDIAIIGIHFQGRTAGYDEAQGLFWLAPTDGLLIEDCKFASYHVNIVLQGAAPIRNVRIRRSVIVDSYDTSAHSQGIYAENVRDLVMEENVFDHNGWNAAVSGAQPTVFNHNVYVQQNCPGLVFRGNVSTRAASHGVQARAGGVIADNLFVRDALSILLGGGATPLPGGVTGQVVNNVVLEGTDIRPSLPRGMAIEVVNIKSGLVAGNVIAHDRSAMPYGHAIAALPPQVGTMGVSNLTIQDNLVYDWRGGLVFESIPYASIRVSANQWQDRRGGATLVRHESAAAIGAFTYADNVYYNPQAVSHWFQQARTIMSLTAFTALTRETRAQSRQITYPDPERSVAKYAATMGRPATFDAFIDGARGQSKDRWNQAFTAASVNAYIREGFGVRRFTGAP